MRDARKWMDRITPEFLDLRQLGKQIDEAFSRDFNNPKIMERLKKGE